MLGPWETAPESTAEAGSRQHRQDKTERVTLDRRRMLKYADLIDKKQSVKFFGSSLKMKKPNLFVWISAPERKLALLSMLNNTGIPPL